MSYILSRNYLFKTDSATSIKFSKSSNYPDDPISTYIEYNTRTKHVEYPVNTKYSKLNNYAGFTLLTEGFITPHHLEIIRKEECIINGLKYYFRNSIKFLECVIYDSEEMKLELSYAYINNGTIRLIICSKDAESWSMQDYIDFLHSTKYFYIEVVDASKFQITQFGAIDTYQKHVLNLSNTRKQYYRSIAINDVDIVSSCISHLKENHPRYDFFSEFSDFPLIKQKSNLIFYDAKLNEPGSEYCTRVLRFNEKYGNMIQSVRTINFEYLTDDFQNYLYFRDQMALTREFYEDTMFVHKDPEGTEWTYTMDWDYEFSPEIERAPATRYFDEITLYSHKFSCKVIGWMVERITNPKRILYPITRFYDKDWTLVGSLFDRSDPNVYSKSYVDLGQGSGIIIEYTKEYDTLVDELNNIIMTEDGFELTLESELDYTPVYAGDSYTLEDGTTVVLTAEQAKAINAKLSGADYSNLMSYKVYNPQGDTLVDHTGESSLVNLSISDEGNYLKVFSNVALNPLNIDHGEYIHFTKRMLIENNNKLYVEKITDVDSKVVTLKIPKAKLLLMGLKSVHKNRNK